MSLLIALLIGVGMGLATGFWFQRNADYLLIDIVMGIAGSITGLFLLFLVNSAQNFSLFSVRGILVDMLGAAVFIGCYQLILAIPKRKHKNVKDGDG